jgi:hypothetical protein
VAAEPSVSLLFEARSASFRAAQWLLAQQREDGSWSGDPSLTTEALAALCESGYAKDGKGKQAMVRAVAWLASPPQQVTRPAASPWRRSHARAQALAACEKAQIPLPQSLAAWRSGLVGSLLATQRGNGCWQDSKQDSETATVHALATLTIAGGEALRNVP